MRTGNNLFMNLKKYTLWYLVLIAITQSVYGQLPLKINILNSVSNNRYYIDSYSKGVKNKTMPTDSLYYYLDDNYKNMDYLFYRDLSDMGYYYMKINDTTKTLFSIRRAIQKGMDSLTVDRFYGAIPGYKDFYKNEIFKSFLENTLIYKSALDSDLINDYEILMQLDQSVRDIDHKASKSKLKSQADQIVRLIDSINLTLIKKFIVDNQGLGFKFIGINYEKFWPLYLHCSDYRDLDYRFIESYVLNGIRNGNLCTYDFLKLFQRHIRDSKDPKNIKNYLVGEKQINEEIISCDYIEQNWLEHGLGSFKLYISTRENNWIDELCDKK